MGDSSVQQSNFYNSIIESFVMLDTNFVRGWFTINDDQTITWNQINNNQSVSWTQVNNVQADSWTEINNSQ